MTQVQQFMAILDSASVDYDYFEPIHGQNDGDNIEFRFDVRNEESKCFSEWNFDKDEKLLSVKHWSY